MPPNSASSTRALFDALRPIHRRSNGPSRCLNAHRQVSQPSTFRHVSTASSHFSEMEVEPDPEHLPRPRWSHTPPAMKAPVRSRLPPEGVTPLKVNADPKKLDQMYLRFLGRGGDTMLSEESKWLAVTHKSFDHGRRGFNDRLAFLGKRIVELQTSLSLLSVSRPSHSLKENQDPFGREPFNHPAIDGVECLTGASSKSYFTYYKQIAGLSARYGIPDVVRWVPKNPDSLSASGSDMVYAQAVFAIIGALALEQGGATANRIAKERILQPMGLKRQIGKKEEEVQT